ncbi:MAG: metal-dependent transcriptional regulator [Thermoleophilaceae bacterium]
MEAQTLSPASPAIEDYAKAIYSLTSHGPESASTNALARRLSLTPGSVSAMLGKLADAGLVEHIPYRGVRLTAEGERVAMAVLRRHRLLESFLAEILEVPWERVHAEAEVLEHVLSADLAELIARKLGDPTVDPHGDPIPTRDGAIVETTAVSLAEVEPGSRARLVRVSDSDPEMLAYLSGLGITVGSELELLERQPFEGPCVVSFEGETRSLGIALARAMRVDTGGDR